MTTTNDIVIAIIGLGYVGLPLAVEFGKIYPTYGFDLSEEKINHYRNFYDPQGEVETENFKAAKHLTVSTDPASISHANIIIIAVPTPVDEAHTPDFSPLVNASRLVGQFMQEGAVVVYESTVYPGATEEICIPVLEEYSGKKWQDDFNVGYSPERVNPGDKERTLTRIVKVVAGDTVQTLETLSNVYGAIISAGVYKASSIKVAEAAKVIENTQRDLNIALMNELSLIFDRLGIDTMEVLDTASTKWNFLPFKPGLVGGHCIGVDPYYLTHKATMIGYHPQIILAGRRINDGMASYVAQQTIKQIIHSGNSVKGSTIIVLGLTFKENCPDLRNSKVAEVIDELKDYGCDVVVHDPLASSKETAYEYRIDLTEWENLPTNADAIVAAVPHKEYLSMAFEKILGKLKPGGVFIDVKSAFDQTAIKQAGHSLWRL